MVKNVFVKSLIMLAIAMSFSSCGLLKIPKNFYNVYKTAPFTDVDKILMLNPGMTINEVRNTLGIDPYNIYHLSEAKSVLLSFSYRLKEKIIKVPTFNIDEINRKTTNEESQTSGEVRYNRRNPKIAFILFKEGKMVSLITTDGNNESERIMIKSNNLSLIQKDEITDYDVIETVEITPSPGDNNVIKRRRKK